MAVRMIVVGTDGSAGAREAMVWCASLAAALGAEVVAVQAYSAIEELATITEPVELSVLASRAATRLHDDWCAPLADAGVAFRSRLIEDLPVEALLAAAEDEHADLIVIGSHGETGWRERILGRVASALPNHAPCPVVIVPQSAPPA